VPVWLVADVRLRCCWCCRRDAATGEVRIGIFTTRDVGVEEELTYDYMFEHYGLSGMAQGFKCQCGAKNCR
jgi:SET domain-containing protein